VAARVVCCPRCGARMGSESVVIREDFWGLTLRTLGDVTIERGASVALKRIEASGKVVVRGALQAQVRAGRSIVVEAGAYWRGSGRAPRFDVHPDAEVVCFYDTSADESGPSCVAVGGAVATAKDAPVGAPTG